MNLPIPPPDWEALSAYLDNELHPRAAARLEARLQHEQALKEALASLRNTRAMLRSTPRIKPPRNFTLTPKMVGMAPVRARPRFYQTFRLAFTLASVLLAVVLFADLNGSFLPARVQQAAESAPAMEALQMAEEPTALAADAAGEVEGASPAGATSPEKGEETQVPQVPQATRAEILEETPAQERAASDAAPTQMLQIAGGGDTSQATEDALPPAPEAEPQAEPEMPAQTPESRPPDPLIWLRVLEGLLVLVAVLAGVGWWWMRQV